MQSVNPSLPRRHAFGQPPAQRPSGAAQSVLGVVVALAFCSWIVVVQHQAPEWMPMRPANHWLSG
jgi:hypothetical protein